MEGRKKLLNVLTETGASQDSDPYEEPLYPSGKAAASIEPVNYEQMPVVLRRLMDEHKACLGVVNGFDAALSKFKEDNWQMSEEVQDGFRNFFMFYDKHISAHNSREERLLFPRLHSCLMAAGEHSSDEYPRVSAIDVLEDDHLQIAQAATVVFNFLGLAPRLPNRESAVIVFDHAYELGKELVENLRLNIIREDETFFPLACQYLSAAQFEELEQAFQVYL